MKHGETESLQIVSEMEGGYHVLAGPFNALFPVFSHSYSSLIHLDPLLSPPLVLFLNNPQEVLHILTVPLK